MEREQERSSVTPPEDAMTALDPLDDITAFEERREEPGGTERRELGQD
jgi:hypothetical protein